MRRGIERTLGVAAAVLSTRATGSPPRTYVAGSPAGTHVPASPAGSHFPTVA